MPISLHGLSWWLRQQKIHKQCGRPYIQFLGQVDSLEGEMATHPKIIAWRIPGMEEPGGLQSARSQRVRHN